MFLATKTCLGGDRARKTSCPESTRHATEKGAKGKSKSERLAPSAYSHTFHAPCAQGTKGGPHDQLFGPTDQSFSLERLDISVCFALDQFSACRIQCKCRDISISNLESCCLHKATKGTSERNNMPQSRDDGEQLGDPKIENTSPLWCAFR